MAYPVRRLRWPSLVGVLGILGLAAGCGPSGPFLRLQIDGISQDVVTLVDAVLYDGKIASSQGTYEVAKRPALTLGLILDKPLMGTLSVTIGGLDGAGCLIRSGDAAIELGAGDTIRDLQISLSAPRPSASAESPSSSCLSPEPSLFTTTPSEIYTSGTDSSGTRGLDLLGWGFHAPVEVQIGEHAQSASVASFQRIHITEPLLLQAPGLATIQVAIAGQKIPVGQVRVNTAPIAVEYSLPRRNVAASALVDAAVGQFSGDARPDVAILDSDGRVWIYESPRDASIAAGANGLTGLDASALVQIAGFNTAHTGVLVAGDVNGDATDDLVVMTTVGGAVLQQQPGSGKFTVSMLPTSPFQGRDAALADMNGDGRRDLIVAGSTSAIYVNAGDGTFLSTPLQPLNGALDAVAALDIDQDGTNDLVAITTAPSPDVWVLRNPGQRGPLLMQTHKLLPTRDPMQPSSLAVADLDGDCAPDVAINGSSTLLLSRKSGPVVHNIDSIRSTFGGTWLAAADANGNYGSTYIGWSITTCRSWNHGSLNRSARRYGSFDPSAA